MKKRTPLYDLHLKYGGKMVEYAGYEMPVQYKGVIAEHQTVRNNVGLFDVSHMGEIWVKGKNALKFLQYVTTNDVAKLTNGKAQYSCLPNGKGGMVDDVIVYKYSDNKYFLVVNASNKQKDLDWLINHNSYGVEIEDASESLALIAIQGPKALDTLQKLTAFQLSGLKPFTFTETEVSGMKNVIVSATGYTGSGGFEIMVYNESAAKLWEALMDAGREYNIQPCGLASRDTLRLEKGFSLYGNDIDNTTSAIEAGLGWIVKLDKSEDFIDKDLLLEQNNKGTSRKIVGFELIDKGIPRKGYEIQNEEGQKIGVVTSGTMSPSLNKAIGMGYVSSENASVGTIVNIAIRNKIIKSKVINLPFV